MVSEKNLDKFEGKINMTTWMVSYFGIIYSYSKTKNNIFLNIQGPWYDVYCFSRNLHQGANSLHARMKYRVVPFVSWSTIFHTVYVIMRPSDTIWWHRSGWTLAQVMACCLMVPSHFLDQYWLIISKLLWHSPEGNFIRDISATIQ